MYTSRIPVEHTNLRIFQKHSKIANLQRRGGRGGALGPRNFDEFGKNRARDVRPPEAEYQLWHKNKNTQTEIVRGRRVYEGWCECERTCVGAKYVFVCMTYMRSAGSKLTSSQKWAFV